MPLNTQIIRDGEALKLRWSGFHVAAMVYATVIDCDGEVGPFQDNKAVVVQAAALMLTQGSIGISPKEAFELGDYTVLGATKLNDGEYTIESEEPIRFIDTTDGEILELRKGDKLVAFRN